MKERDTAIDYLRTLGILLLVVAHTSPPKLVFFLRSFDVPLMVFISGICLRITSASNETKRITDNMCGKERENVVYCMTMWGGI